MRNVFYLSLLFLLIFHLSFCTSVKKSKNTDLFEETTFIGKTDSLFKNDYDNLKIYCEEDSIFFDKKLNLLRSSDIDVYYCLREKSFQGDTIACRQIATIIPLMRIPFSVYNKNLRGDILFKAVLDQLNNFEFIPGPGGDMDFYTYFGSHARVLYEMIESINGISVTNYLQNHYPERFNNELMGIELYSPEYMQKSGKIKWEVIKEAYDKGLIKLKDFGQE
ncbi:MAG: hypothetical protein WAT79_16165 [Saprospiraceae bacterium]